MAQINGAYGVLSDPDQRPEYDRLREKRTQSADTAFADGDEEPTTRSPRDEDWQTALQSYPDLVGLRTRLAKLSRIDCNHTKPLSKIERSRIRSNA